MKYITKSQRFVTICLIFRSVPSKGPGIIMAVFNSIPAGDRGIISWSVLNAVETRASLVTAASGNYRNLFVV